MKSSVMWAAAGILVLFLSEPSLALAQDAVQSVEAESRGVFTSILRIVIRWIFPVGAAYCFLFGIIGKGVKRGEWDMAAICAIASIALALFPKLLGSLFGMDMGAILG